MFRTRSLPIRALLAVLVLGACDNPNSPEPLSMQKVAGTYSAAQGLGAMSLTTTANGETIDWLALGATFRMDLAPDGTTTGRLFIPGADDDGGDMDVDLVGKWTLQGDTIHFSHDADTFIRDMPFLVKGDLLEGNRTFSDVRIRFVLRRQ